jgi:hypothetical protein
MKEYTKESLIHELLKIREMGWISSHREGNVGGVGNTIEDLLGIEENNLPIPNASEWELKCQKKETTSLITLFHMEPSPRAFKFVPKVLLAKYGWPHQTIENEMSFRQTITGSMFSDRGFKVVVNRTENLVLISFDKSKICDHHKQWKESVENRAGLGELVTCSPKIEPV